MDIRSINTDFYTNNTTFKQRYAYKDIKLLPKLTCACCGRTTINPNKLHSAFSKITRPLKIVMEKGFFNPWMSHLPTWNVLTNFCKTYPDKSLDVIVQDHDNFKLLKSSIADSVKINPMGKILETEKEFSNNLSNLYGDLITRSRSELKCSKTVMQRFKPFKNSLAGEKLDTFEQLEIYAQKYPRKTLSQIINMEEIHKFHEAKDMLQRAETREKMDFAFNNIYNMLIKENPNEEESFIDTKNEAIALLETVKDPDARIPGMKSIYTRALKEKGLEKLLPKVLKELEQVPVSFITKDSFLAYAYRHNFTDIQIISSLLTPSVASFEHIIPSVKGGDDASTNGLVFCRECNRRRGAIPYTEFMQYHPQMARNVQKQITEISNYILNGTLSYDFIDWPIEVSRTLETYTDGKIKPNAIRYSQKISEKIADKIKDKEEQIGDIQSARTVQYERRETLRAELEQLENEILDKKAEYRNAKQELATDLRLKNKFDDYVEKSKK